VPGFRGKTSDDFSFAALPPEEAIEYFRRKGFEIGFDWRDIWQDEHARAFTVAKAMTLGLLTDIRDVVDKAIADGIAFEDFRDNLEPVLRARGWWGRAEMTDPLTGEARDVQLGSYRRLGIIYDTNLRTSYSAGAWKQMQEAKELQPYLRYVDPDPNPRPEHLDWSGTILRADDPWWETHWPPNGWNCKCYADSLSDKDLEAENLQLSAVAPPEEATEYYNPRTGTPEMIPRGIDQGFNYNVGIAGINFAAEQALQEKLAISDDDLAAAVQRLEPPARKTYLQEVATKWESASDEDEALRNYLTNRPGAKQLLQRLGPDELRAISDYTDWQHVNYNQPLRAGTQRVTEEQRALARALTVLPVFEGTTWRGLEGWSFERATAYFKPGRLFNDFGFVSTSSNRRIAERRFAGKEGTLLEVRGKSGRQIAPLSTFRHEREVLFPPGRAFRVKSVRKIGRRTHVILEEV
jgi:SPP1 gp7 family putative phage head morphogenesis protein